MAPPSKKRKVDESPENNLNGTNGHHTKPPINMTATSEEKAQWQGFCELESEPVKSIETVYLE